MFGRGRSGRASAPAMAGVLHNVSVSEPAALLASLERSVPEYLKETDEGRLVYPACKRTSTNAGNDVRTIWEHTRLEALRYVTMVPRRQFDLLIHPSRQLEMFDVFLRRRPHEETVIDFNGFPAEDYSN